MKVSEKVLGLNLQLVGVDLCGVWMFDPYLPEFPPGSSCPSPVAVCQCVMTYPGLCQLGSAPAPAVTPKDGRVPLHAWMDVITKQKWSEGKLQMRYLFNICRICFNQLQFYLLDTPALKRFSDPYTHEPVSLSVWSWASYRHKTRLC